MTSVPIGRGLMGQVGPFTGVACFSSGTTGKLAVLHYRGPSRWCCRGRERSVKNPVEPKSGRQNGFFEATQGRPCVVITSPGVGGPPSGFFGCF